MISLALWTNNGGLFLYWDYEAYDTLIYFRKQFVPFDNVADV